MVKQTQDLELKQGQSLALTPALRQSISILQLSTTDLVAEIGKEINENPVLEIEDDGVGSMVLSEVSAGRIRNLRNYVSPGKIVVCKVFET